MSQFSVCYCLLKATLVLRIVWFERANLLDFNLNYTIFFNFKNGLPLALFDILVISFLKSLCRFLTTAIQYLH